MVSSAADRSRRTKAVSSSLATDKCTPFFMANRAVSVVCSLYILNGAGCPDCAHGCDRATAWQQIFQPAKTRN